MVHSFLLVVSQPFKIEGSIFKSGRQSMTKMPNYNKVYHLEIHSKDGEPKKQYVFYDITNLYRVANKEADAFPYNNMIYNDCIQIRDALDTNKECYAWITKDSKFWAKVTMWEIEDAK